MKHAGVHFYARHVRRSRPVQCADDVGFLGCLGGRFGGYSVVAAHCLHSVQYLQTHVRLQYSLKALNKFVVFFVWC